MVGAISRLDGKVYYARRDSVIYFGKEKDTKSSCGDLMWHMLLALVRCIIFDHSSGITCGSITQMQAVCLGHVL